MSNDDIIKRAPDKELSLRNIDLQCVVDYYQGKLERTQLTPQLADYVQKMDFCAELTKDYLSRLRVVPILMKTYGISMPTARMLFERTQMILGEAQSVSLSQPFHVDILLGNIGDLYRKALSKGDYRSAAAALKLQKETIKELMGNGDASRYERFVMAPITIGFFPEKFKNSLPDNLDAEIEKIKAAKKRKHFGQKVQDIGYEEV